MNIDLSPVLFFATTGTYVLTRSTHVAPVNGKAQAPTTATVSIQASVQPVSDDDLQILPEGLRSRETKKLFSTSPMLPAHPELSQLPDTIVIDGDTWQVQYASQWGTFANYYRALVQRVGNG